MSTERIKVIVEDLERMLLEFVDKHQITHAEYRAATSLIIDEVQAGEASLLFDVFLEAATTDVANTSRQGSIEAIEGPFYIPGAPELTGAALALPQREDEKGEVLFFSGTVRTLDGDPLAGAEVDMWHADAAGMYSQIHPGLPEWNLRGRFKTDDSGGFEVRTILPPPYEIPKNGPTGNVLKALGRHFFRPAHLHLKLRHPGYGQMTSQLYFAGGAYLDNDVANAVRDGLILQLETHDADEAAKRGLRVDRYLSAHYDFVLSSHEA